MVIINMIIIILKIFLFTQLNEDKKKMVQYFFCLLYTNTLEKLTYSPESTFPINADNPLR